MRRVLVLHGPSLSHLGRREPHLYGTTTLSELNALLARHAQQVAVVLDVEQTNHEGRIIDRVLGARDDGFCGVVMNAGAYAHTSLAIADAVRACGVPVVEVHLTNTAARDPARHAAPVGAAAAGRVEGFGPFSYVVGLDALLHLVDRGASAP